MVFFREEVFEEITKAVEQIFEICKKEELLVNDIRGTLMGNGNLTYDLKKSWNGLTSRDISILPRGKQLRSDLEYVGEFRELLEKMGYTTRYEQHASGIKYFAAKPKKNSQT